MLRIPEKTTLSLLLTLVVATASASDRTLEPGTAASVGMSDEVIESGFQLFERAVANDALQGGVVLVARQGRVVLHKAFGWSNREASRRMEVSTLFKMASNTKPVVATAVLRLADQGKLELNDNVRQHLPSWDNYRAGYIKIRHLLSHTSGLRIPGVFLEPLLQASDENPDAPSLAAEVARFGRIGADEVPGTTYSYNNPAYQALGHLVATASGESLKEFLQKEIYAPLGMSDSWNHESDAPPERMARIYRRRQGGWKTVWSPGDEADWPFVRGSGGMISTALDYAKFCQMYLNGGVYGGQRILSAPRVAAATQRQTSVEFPGYGLGWVVAADGFGHNGSDGTFGWIDPRNELIVLVFTQCQNGQNPRDQFLRIVVDACDPLPEDQVPK